MAVKAVTFTECDFHKFCPKRFMANNQFSVLCHIETNISDIALVFGSFLN